MTYRISPCAFQSYPASFILHTRSISNASSSSASCYSRPLAKQLEKLRRASPKKCILLAYLNDMALKWHHPTHFINPPPGRGMMCYVRSKKIWSPLPLSSVLPLVFSSFRPHDPLGPPPSPNVEALHPTQSLPTYPSIPSCTRTTG